MSAARHDLDNFYAFGLSKLEAEGDQSLDDLFLAWDATRERQQINEAIRDGLADIDAGRTRPAGEWIAELKAGVESESDAP